MLVRIIDNHYVNETIYNLFSIYSLLPFFITILLLFTQNIQHFFTLKICWGTWYFSLSYL